MSAGRNDASVAKPKLVDVAGLAGVSVSTASRALAGHKGVAAETVRGVREAAVRVGYPLPLSPHESEGTSTLGVIVANIASSFFAALIEAIEESASIHGYNIILCNSDNQLKKQREYLNLLIEKRVDGLIIVPVEMEDPFLQDLVDQGLLVVQVDRYVEGLKCDAVISDNERSTYQAVNFLIQQGYERIAIVSGPVSHSTGRGRMIAYRKALEDSGLPIQDKYVKIGGLKSASGYQLASELIEATERPDALFVTTMEMTVGVLLSIRDHNLVIPDDMGIVAFDEFENACLLEPPLTTVEQPVYDLGSTAADLLIRRIDNNLNSYEPVTIQLRSRLIVRDSTRSRARTIRHVPPVSLNENS
jgi:DNA-binding LacI/PurR family transcriptional regulator